MKRYVITVDIPDDHHDNNTDPWMLLSYLTDVYSSPELIEPEDEDGIAVGVVEVQP